MFVDQSHHMTCVSLGPACPCASALRRNGLRHHAFPFDWIVSDASVVDACLTDAFDAFLDVRKCSHASERRASPCSASHVRACDHAVFGSSFFRHHCPLCVPEHHSYLVRTTRRMMDVCAGPASDSVVFVWMNILPADQDTPLRHAAITVELQAMMLALQAHVCGGRHRLLALECYGGCDRRDALLVPSRHPTELLVRVRVHGMSVNAGCCYADAADNDVVDRILLEWHARWTSPNLDVSACQDEHVIRGV